MPFSRNSESLDGSSFQVISHKRTFSDQSKFQDDTDERNEAKFLIFKMYEIAKRKHRNWNIKPFKKFIPQTTKPQKKIVWVLIFSFEGKLPAWNGDTISNSVQDLFGFMCIKIKRTTFNLSLANENKTNLLEQHNRINFSCKRDIAVGKWLGFKVSWSLKFAKAFV